MAIPDFIVQLRRKIGHAPLFLPGVTAVVLKDVAEDAPLWAVPEVLLVRRADDGQWTPVTGIVDPGEEPHVAAVREVREETGLEVEVEALLGVGAVGPVTYPNGDVVQYMDTAMRCRIAGGSAGAQEVQPIIGDDESTAVGFYPISNMPPVSPRFRLVIADAVAQLKHPQGYVPRIGYRKRER
ncbi:NUDIX hydrolase [Corynebacterium heidelbergense]|uniref:DNA mismatch repair protein MutT n=1 Tax=Corynebacterium heidelbergense TaxID=2055947 RepID=A0A364VC67_9CORY|nr:NUDIX domain-containing protein [Corynebacterium heidelbergense]RAV34166.1 DNA mismatch repair protein MutT [Corynebacterium heidelbergense]